MKNLLTLMTVLLTFHTGQEIQAQDSLGVRKVGDFLHYWDGALKVAVSGDYAYVATGRSGFGILNISDMDNPEEVGYCGTIYAGNLTVSDNHLYVCSNRLNIYNVENPLEPVLVGEYGVGGTPQDVFVNGNYAYIAYDLGGLRIVDVSDPSNPQRLGQFRSLDGATCVEVLNDIAYVGYQEGMGVLDVSNPEAIRSLGFYRDNVSVKDLYVDGDFAYLAAGSGGLRIVNIADPSNPRRVGVFSSQGDSRGIIVQGEFAYLSVWDGGLQIVDVSNKTSPRGVSSYRRFVNSSFLDGNTLFIACSSDGLWMLDVTNPEESVELAYFDTNWGPFDLRFANNHVFVADGDAIVSVDVSDPQVPNLVGKLTLAGSKHLAILNNRGYVCADGGIYTLDISNPESLDILGHYPDRDTTFHGVIATNGMICAIDTYGRIHFIDVRNPARPWRMSMLPGRLVTARLSIKDDYLYIADYYFRIVDISDPHNPSESSSIALPAGNDTEHGLAIVQDFAYVWTSYWEGDRGYGQVYRYLQIIDISNPHDPRILSSTTQDWFTANVSVQGSFIFAINDGVKIISVLNPLHPEITGYYRPGSAGKVLPVNELIYAAQRFNISILNHSGATWAPTEHQVNPANYHLQSAFPNPFNTQTWLTYQMRQSGWVILRVYNGNGGLVDVLSEGFAPSGKHTLLWNADGLSAGNYLIELSTPNGQAVSNATLVK